MLRLLGTKIPRSISLLKKVVFHDLTKQTAVCVALVGFGDLLAQMYMKQLDTKRLTDMALAGSFLGPWYKERIQRNAYSTPTLEGSQTGQKKKSICLRPRPDMLLFDTQ